MKILVLSSDSDIQEVFSAEIGHDCEAVTTQEDFENIDFMKYQLVFLDWDEELEFTFKMIDKIKSDFLRPVVLVTGKMSVKEIREHQRSPKAADAYIFKPTTSEAILDTIGDFQETITKGATLSNESEDEDDADLNIEIFEPSDEIEIEELAEDTICGEIDLGDVEIDETNDVIDNPVFDHEDDEVEEELFAAEKTDDEATGEIKGNFDNVFGEENPFEDKTQPSLSFNNVSANADPAVDFDMDIEEGENIEQMEAVGLEGEENLDDEVELDDTEIGNIELSDEPTSEAVEVEEEAPNELEFSGITNLETDLGVGSDETSSLSTQTADQDLEEAGEIDLDLGGLEEVDMDEAGEAEIEMDSGDELELGGGEDLSMDGGGVELDMDGGVELEMSSGDELELSSGGGELSLGDSDDELETDMEMFGMQDDDPEEDKPDITMTETNIENLMESDEDASLDYDLDTSANELEVDEDGDEEEAASDLEFAIGGPEATSNSIVDDLEFEKGKTNSALAVQEFQYRKDETDGQLNAPKFNLDGSSTITEADLAGDETSEIQMPEALDADATGEFSMSLDATDDETMTQHVSNSSADSSTLAVDSSAVDVHLNSEELVHLQGTIRQLREERDQLLTKISDLESENRVLEQDSLSKRAELDEVKIELNIMRKRQSSDHNEMRKQLSISEEKKAIYEEKMKRLQGEFDRLNQKVRYDINKVRQREKELEGQLELVKLDSESQIKTRDMKILELKRKIDSLEFNIENATLKEQRSVLDKHKLEDKLGKVMQTLRRSIKVIEEDIDYDENSDTPRLKKV